MAMTLPDKLNGTLRAFIEAQPMFFVGTAAAEGRVNISPKGMDTLKILDDQHIRWLSLSGSGNETAGHLRLDPRITMMWCAFEGDARILRAFGTATVLHPDDAGWDAAAADFPTFGGARQIYNVTIDAVRLSCGTGVPEMAFKRQRGPEELVPFYDEMGPEGVKDYWARKNSETIDGFPTGTA